MMKATFLRNKFTTGQLNWGTLTSGRPLKSSRVSKSSKEGSSRCKRREKRKKKEKKGRRQISGKGVSKLLITGN